MSITNKIVHASLNSKVILSGGFILIILLGIISNSLWHSWVGTFESSRIVSQNLARSLAAHTSATIESIDAYLRNIEYLFNEEEGLQHLSPEGTRIIASQIENSSIVFSAHIFNNRGEMVQSATPTKGIGFGVPQKTVNIKENELHKTLSNPHTIEQSYLMIGRPVVGEVTGEWMLPIARGMYDTDGQFAGIVMASIPVEKFEHLYSAFEAAPGFTVALARKDGRFLIRTPFNPVFYGKNFSEIPFFRDVLPRNLSGYFEDGNSIDKKTRMIFYQSVNIIKQWLSTEMLTIVITIIALLVLMILALIIRKHARLLIEQHDVLEKTVTKRTQELSDANSKLKQLASIDSLTGVANRHVLDKHLDREFRLAVRNKTEISMAMIDVDYFKKFNDNYGHQAGDQCLKHIATVLQRIPKRPADMIARYGGEEFCFIFPCTDELTAFQLAEEARRAIEKEDIGKLVADAKDPVTISIGVATMSPKSGDNVNHFMKKADSALYVAKEEGRNQVQQAI